MKPSLRTIAQDLGLSKATISWILSGKGVQRGFCDATIKLVTEHAKKVGYRPNLLARSLSMGVTNTVGLVIPAIGDTFYSQVTQAIEEHLQNHGYTLIISTSEGDPLKEERIVQSLMAQQVDGLIIAPAMDDSATLNDVTSSGYPLVCIDRHTGIDQCNYVIVNNEQASFDLASAIIKRGAKKIAIIISDSHLDVIQRRQAGYRRALETNGLYYDDSLVIDIPKTLLESDIDKAIANLLEKHPDLDGFFFATHYIAIEAIRYFSRVGIDYNKRFAMGSFHTAAALEVLAPGIIISLMPIGQIGHQAVDKLVKNIKDRDNFTPEPLVLSNTLLAAI